MSIQEYEPGAEIRQYNETVEGFRTGLVCARYYDPDIREINGETIDIKLVCDSPEYGVGESKQGSIMVIEQTKVTIRHQNDNI